MYPTVRLEEFLSFSNGRSISPGGDGPIPVYGANGVIGGCEEARFLDGVVIGRVGAYCGAVKYPGAPFWASDNTIVAVPSRGDDMRFCAYLLGWRGLNRWAGGSAQPLLTQAVLKRVEAPLPSRNVQRRIASILSAYDDLIENNVRRIEILEEMARSLYREWFVHFRFPGHEQVRLVDSSLGQIPKGWEIGRLDDALVLQRGFDLPNKSRVPGSVPIYASTGMIGTHNEARATGPAVVTGRSGSLGTVCLVEGDYWPLNTALWSSELRRASAYFAYFLLQEIDLTRVAGGAAVPTLNRNHVHAMEIVLPPATEIGRFDKRVIPMFELQTLLRNQNQVLREARDLLLPRLMSGEIDVDSLDLPEPP